MFRFNHTLTPAERAMLVEEHGELAVRNHAIFLANSHRVHALFPPSHTPLTLAEIQDQARR